MTEAPSFIPSLFRGMVFVAVTSVRKMCPSFRTSYIIVANFRIALIFIQCYLPSAILVVVEDVDVEAVVVVGAVVVVEAVVVDIVVVVVAAIADTLLPSDSL